jgi:RNA polymerase sigma factor (sigma-70 family)
LQSSDPVLKQYYQALSRVKTYTPEEERALFREYKITHSRNLRRLLIESCLKLVFSLARRYWMDKNPDTLKALISAGNVGLVEAVDKFDPERGTRFASYAAFWILMHMRTELTSLHEVVAPSSKERKYRMQSAATRRKRGEKVTSADSRYRSLTAGPEESLPCLPSTDLTGSSSALSKREELQSITDAQDLFGRWFRFLTVREQFILRAYFGLINSGEGLRLRQIAGYLGLSSERVRQLKAGSLAKLRRWLAYDDVGSYDDVF